LEDVAKVLQYLRLFLTILKLRDQSQIALLLDQLAKVQKTLEKDSNLPKKEDSESHKKSSREISQKEQARAFYLARKSRVRRKSNRRSKNST
jgi:hypothetical protein